MQKGARRGGKRSPVLNETGRRGELVACLDIATRGQRSLEDIAELAALHCASPIAVVRLIGGRNYWFTSGIVGKTAALTLDSAPWKQLAAERGLVIVADAPGIRVSSMV